MERVHLDILGPFHLSKGGNRYILVMVDQFTKWVELAALPEQNAQATVRAFMSRFVSTFGCPLEIHTDQGKNFQSDLFKAFCEVFEISTTRTTPYRPSSNGQCEVFNRTILSMIRSYISRGLKDWDEFLPTISRTLHSMKNKSTGFSANMLMLGRETIQPLDILLGRCDFLRSDHCDWLKNLVSNLSQAHSVARTNIGEAQFRQKRDYDLRVLQHPYELGDTVYICDSSTKVGVSAKLRPPWKGPFLVTNVRTPVYTVEDRKNKFVIHHDRLKPCLDSDLPVWLKRKRHNLLGLASQGDRDPKFDNNDNFRDIGLLDSNDNFPDIDFGPELSVDLDATLPYMLPDDSIHDFSDDISNERADPDTRSQTALEPHSSVTSRTGRHIKLPERYRE